MVEKERCRKEERKGVYNWVGHDRGKAKRYGKVR